MNRRISRDIPEFVKQRNGKELYIQLIPTFLMIDKKKQELRLADINRQRYGTEQSFSGDMNYQNSVRKSKRRSGTDNYYSLT